ncbi:DNA repair protein RecN [Numidum massiliense]|uniref:DNA repair protein RecN n=1 Tax=Numidum massiliense TaxID=1522315 RepID=UPI0006D57ACB|nr:DNA repair protein RecN [Numidum massiliense]
MIRELSIRNLAVVEAVDVSFAEGLHVLTGETGAGKSIVVDAIGLVLGARGSADFVRHRAKKAEITALFDFDKAHPVWDKLRHFGFDVDGEQTLLLKRDISRSGKSTCRVNGQIVTLAMLKQIAEKIVDIHGQHDQQSLLSEEDHLHWLDAFAGEAIEPAKRAYGDVYREYRQVEAELKALTKDERLTAQRIDLLQFQVREIAAASLEVGEDGRLTERHKQLAHAERLSAHLQEAYFRLQGEGGALDDVGEALTQIEAAISYDTALQSELEPIKNAFYLLEDAILSLRRKVDAYVFDPKELNEVELRLSLIDQLKRKYAATLEEIVAYGEEAERELGVLQNKETHQHALGERLEALRRELAVKARQLTAIREQAAAVLEREVEGQLRDLRMKNTQFRIVFTSPEEEAARAFGVDGWDQLLFALSTNPGEPVKPLAKIASGGELARVMLALKTVFNEVDAVETLIFDEVDTGVSGRAAQAIAEKMVHVASGRQVLCVTHLPQVACMADRHYYIEKQVAEDSTVTRVQPLKKQGRVDELARMLGGVEVTRKTKQHAAEMLRLAAARKQEKAHDT